MILRLYMMLLGVLLVTSCAQTRDTLPTTSLTPQESDTLRVLFVGNSYTYFWNLPQHVSALAAAKGKNIITKQSTYGGTHWGHHWRGHRGIRTREMIQSGEFDIVVLQNHSKSTFNRPDSLMHYGQLLAKEIRAAGAEPMLYMTWSREYDSTMIETIRPGYERLAKKINCQVAPVGIAWSRAYALNPDLGLYDPDGSHPSPVGTYLTACVMYSMLTHESPVGLRNRVKMKDDTGQELNLNILSKERALFCQKIAAEVVQEYLD